MHYQIEGGSPQFLSLNKYIQNFWKKDGLSHSEPPRTVTEATGNSSIRM